MQSFLLRTARGLCLFGVIASAVAAQFTLTKVDGATLIGRPAGLDSEGRLLWRTGEKTEAFALDALVGFESSSQDLPRPEGGARLDLVGGDVLFAALEDGPADELHASAAGLGRLVFALDDVRTVWNREGRGDSTVELPKPAADDDQDYVFVERDGRLDFLPGTLERVAKSELVFSSAAGDKRPFAFVKDKVVAVRIAVDAKARPGRRTCAVLMRNGSRLTGVLKAGPEEGLRLKLANGPEAALDPDQLKAVTMTGEAFRMLSDLEASAFVSAPYLADGTPPVLLRDRGARPGEPLSIGTERFAKGLLLFAKSEVTYPASGFGRFTAKIGVDPITKSRPLPGSAKLVVYVDGAVRWTSPLLRAGAEPLAVNVDVRGAKELKLVVEFADSFDSGARVALANAMLLK